MIDIIYSESGEISLIQIKTYEANMICNKIIENTETNLELLGENGINIKGGLFTNIPILSGWGRNYNFNFNQIGAVSCNYHSKFVTAGIVPSQQCGKREKRQRASDNSSCCNSL